MAADFKFLMEFGAESKQVDSVLKDIKNVKNTLEDIKKSGSLGSIMGTEDINEARVALDKMASSLEKMKKDGKDVINADEMANHCQRLVSELRQVDLSMDKIEKSSDDVEENLRDSTKETRSFKAAMNELQNSIAGVGKTSDGVHRAFSKIGETLKWKAIDASMNTIESALQGSYYMAKDFDRVMTEIRIVTGDTSAEVENFVNQTSSLADSLSSTMLKFSEASVLFLQQGKSRSDATELAKQTVIAANITGVSSREAAELMTSAQEGFRRSADEASNTLDIFARLGAETGSNFQEIATSLSKSASSFSAAGFDIEKASAALATVSSVTRQSAEQIGTGFKTIVARLTSVKEGGEGAAEATSKIENALKRVNKEMELTGDNTISIFGSNGDMKSGQEILEVVGDNWERIKDSTSQVTQNILMEAVAGKEQANRVLALYENWDMYTASVEKAINSEGYAYQQQLIYQDSLKAKLNEMSNEIQTLFMSEVGIDLFKGIIESATNVLEILNGWSERGMFFENAISPIVSLIGLKLYKNVKDVGEGFASWANNLNSVNPYISKIQEKSLSLLGVNISLVKEQEEQILKLEKHIAKKERLLVIEKETEAVSKRRTKAKQDNIVKLEKELSLEKQKLDVLKKENQQTMNKGSANISGAIDKVFTLLPVITEATSMMRTFGNEAATAGDKVDATIKTVSTGLGAAASTVFGPGAALVGSLVGDALAMLVNYETASEKTTKKMELLRKETDASIKSFGEKAIKLDQATSATMSLKSQMDELDGSVKSYNHSVKILDGAESQFTETQKEQAKIAQEVALQQGEILSQIDPSSVAYDHLGRAIVETTLSYEDLIEKIQDLKRETAEEALSDPNLINNTRQTIKHAQDMLDEAQAKFNEEKSKGSLSNETIEALDEARKYNEDIALQVASISGWLRDANEEYANLSDSAKAAGSFLFDPKLVEDSLGKMTGFTFEAYEEVSSQFIKFLDGANEKQLESINMLSEKNKRALLETIAAYGVQGEQVLKVLDVASKDFDSFFETYKIKMGEIEGLNLIDPEKEVENARAAIKALDFVKKSIQKNGSMTGFEQQYAEAESEVQSFVEIGIVKQFEDGTYKVRKDYKDMLSEIDAMMKEQSDKLFIINPDILESQMDTAKEIVGTFVVNSYEASEPIKLLTEAIETLTYTGLNGFNDLGKATKKELTDALIGVKDEVPGLTTLLNDMMDGSIESTEEYSKVFSEAMQKIKDEAPDVYGEIIGNSSEFYQDWLNNNKLIYAGLFESIGISAEDLSTEFNTILELKYGLVQGLISQQGEVSEEQLTALADTGLFTYDELGKYTSAISKLVQLESEQLAIEVMIRSMDTTKGLSAEVTAALGAVREEIRKTKEELNGLAGAMPTGIDTNVVEKDLLKTPTRSYIPSKKSSGSSSAKKDVENIKYIEDILHRYEKQLGVLEDKLAKYGRAYDHAFGYDKVKNLQTQNKLLEERANILRKEISLIENQTKGYSDTLSKKGFKMNDVGTIINKDDVFSKMYSSANSKKGSAKEEAQKQVKEIEEVFKNYEANVKLKMDTTKALNEAFHEIQDNYREGFEIELNLVLDVNKLIREVKGVQDSMVSGFGNSAKQMDNLAKSWQNGASDLDRIAFNMDRIVNDPKLDAVAKYDLMQDNMSQFISEFENLQSVFEEILEMQKQVVVDSVDLVQTQLDGFEKLIGYASDLANLYSDFYGTDGYKDVSKFYKIQLDGIKEQEKGTEDLIRSLEKYVRKLESAGQKGSEAWKEAKSQIAELEDQMVQLAAKTVSTLQEQYEKFIETALDKLQENIFGMPFDELANQMDKLEGKQDKYLDSTEKVLKVSDLQAKIQKQIDEINDPEKQAKLTEYLQSQMELLREKDGLTERDLKRAELQYQLLLKQQAAEAQSASGKMVGRLSRDESGNWSMEYVAEIEKIEDKQSEITDALNKLVDFDRESLEENQKEIMKLLGDFNKQSQDIIEKYKNDPAEMAKQLEKLEQEFGKELDILKLEREALMKSYMESSVSSILEIAKTDSSVLDVFGKENAKILKQLVDSLKSGDLTIQDVISQDVSKISEALGVSIVEVETALGNMFGQINNDFKDFNDILGSIDVSDIGDAFDQIVGQSQDMINQITSAMKDYEDAIGNLNNKLEEQREATLEANKETKNQLDEVGKLIESFGGNGGLNDQLEELNKLSTDYFNILQTRLQDVKNHIEQTDVYTNAQLLMQGQVINSTGTMNTFSNQLNSTSTSAKNASASVDNLRNSISSLKDKTVTITTVYKTVGSPSSSSKPDAVSSAQSKTYSDGFKNRGYASGGYTGDGLYSGGEDGMGGFGALLHPKELVLNKSDTQNMLKAVEAVRDAAKNSMFANINSASNASSGRVQRSIINSSDISSNEQNQTYIVENINLPSVDNAEQFTTELKSIFSNMSNKATQYAYRVKSN